MTQSTKTRTSSFARKAFGFVRAMLFALACFALLASLFAQNGNAEVYRITGWVALGTASLIALPFEFLDGRRNRKAMKERARAMTRLQRVSSGLNDR
jgi:Na+/melibiose symporter-like transporter